MAVKLEDLSLSDFSENKIIDLCGGRKDLSAGITCAHNLISFFFNLAYSGSGLPMRGWT